MGLSPTALATRNASETAEADTLGSIDTSEISYSVAVVDDDPKLRTRLAMQLGEGVAVASFPSIEAMEEKFASGTALVVVFGPSYADPAGLKAVQGLTRYRPEVGSLMVVEELTTAML